MNTIHTASTKTAAAHTAGAAIAAPALAPSARIQGAGLAAMLTVAMLLGINTLAHVEPADALMASAATHSTDAPAAPI